MEQAFLQYDDVLMERGVSKNDGFDAAKNELNSFEKPEEQMIA
jgi:hypothetical protein